MVYAIHVEIIERAELALYQARLTGRALGSDLEVPTLGSAQRQLDEWLESPPAVSDAESDPFRRDWMISMGMEVA